MLTRELFLLEQCGDKHVTITHQYFCSVRYENAENGFDESASRYDCRKYLRRVDESCRSTTYDDRSVKIASWIAPHGECQTLSILTCQ